MRYSDSAGGVCVEVAALPEAVHVRDCEDASEPRPVVTAGSWARVVEFAAG